MALILPLLQWEFLLLNNNNNTQWDNLWCKLRWCSNNKVNQFIFNNQFFLLDNQLGNNTHHQITSKESQCSNRMLKDNLLEHKLLEFSKLEYLLCSLI